jgi:hypothetical protein
MADIKLVIKIPEYMFEDIQDRYKHPNKGDGINLLEYAVANGKPLPKGHGDLIDRNEIEYMKAIHDLVWGKITSSECATKIKYSAPTIIKADEVEE